MAVKITECRWGKQLYFDTDLYFAPLLTRYGDYNYGEVDLFRQLVRAGDTVVDAGANIGCHTLSFANIVGPAGVVMAFEVQRPVYDLLCGTIALNEAWQVSTYLCALGATRGMTKVPFTDYGEPFSFGGVSIGALVGHDVPQMPLDDFAVPGLRLLKVDVEGGEVEVLTGARETIGKFRPFLYVENDRRERSAELIETMLGYGYRVYLHTPLLYDRRNWRGCTEDLFPKVASIMLLGVPTEVSIGEVNLKQLHRPEDMPCFGEHVI
jgi:FkbM family methyltransferase